MDRLTISLSVPRVHVKRVKTALEERDLLDRTAKITASQQQSTRTDGPRMSIPTLIHLNPPLKESATEASSTSEEKELVLRDLGLEDLLPIIDIQTSHSPQLENPAHARNPLLKGLATALDNLPPDLLLSLDIVPRNLLEEFPTTYSVYKPLLLLPAHAFSSPSWRRLVHAYPLSEEGWGVFWEGLERGVGVSCVAVNAGIPLSTSTSSPSSSSTSTSTSSSTGTIQKVNNIRNEKEKEKENENENILRSPSNITPLHGSFGPPPTPTLLTHPTSQDYASALWVSTCQNGIHQVWAPLYTMFSRGNMREKMRVLNLSSVRQEEHSGEVDSVEGNMGNMANRSMSCTAVDLYAGIGYFAFCYKKAGVRKVLCWELNPWSIEGLRRGAELNGWGMQVVGPIPLPLPTPQPQSTTQSNATNVEEELEAWKASINPDVDFLVFQQSNELAGGPITALKQNPSLPPIRHVNCGFLPSSRLSWPTAIRVIDEEVGGWIHAHENVGVKDVEPRKEDVEKEMQGMLDRLWNSKHADGEGEGGCSGRGRRRVRCEHVERVKTYAPGVVHVVFDVWVDGTTRIVE